MEKKIIAIKKNNIWYLSWPQFDYHSDWTKIRINDKPVILCPDAKWASVLEEPKIIEQLITPAQKIVAYVRKEEFKNEVLSVGDRVEPDFFACVCTEDYETRQNEAFYNFFQPAYEQPERYWQKLDWEVLLIDSDAEPIEMTLPVKIDFPNNIAQYPQVHHKYPCRILSDNLFKVVSSRIIRHIGNSPFYKIQNYDNIGVLHVERKIGLVEAKSFKVDVSRWGARKPKYETRTTKEELKMVLSLYSSQYKNASGDYVPTIQADNYKELESKVEEYIGSILSQLPIESANECSHCRGFGYIFGVAPKGD